MRLGDLDALYDKVSDHVTSVSVCATAQQAIGQTKFKWRYLEDIHNAPTIDAIPVEWLEAQIKSYTGDVSDIGKSARNGTIKDLIRKWQKEQEAR